MVGIGFVPDRGLRQEQVELADEAATPTAEIAGLRLEASLQG